MRHASGGPKAQSIWERKKPHSKALDWIKALGPYLLFLTALAKLATELLGGG